MPAGLHLENDASRPMLLSAPFEILLANAGGSTWHASQTQAGSNPAAGSGNGLSKDSRQPLSPTLQNLRRMQGELHLI